MKKKIIFTILLLFLILLVFVMFGQITGYITSAVKTLSSNNLDRLNVSAIKSGIFKNAIYSFILFLIIIENIYLLIKIWKNKEVSYQDYKEKKAKKQAIKREKKKQELKKKLQDLEDD